MQDQLKLEAKHQEAQVLQFRTTELERQLSACQSAPELVQHGTNPEQEGGQHPDLVSEQPAMQSRRRKPVVRFAGWTLKTGLTAGATILASHVIQLQSGQD